MGRQPMAGISERPPAEGRPYTVLSTVGMSCQRMPGVERLVQDPAAYARIELAMATTMPPAQAARIFLWLAPYPWRAVTWFGPGHSVRWYHEPATFPLGGGYEAVLLLEAPGGLPGPDAPDLSGFSFGGDPVALALGGADHGGRTADRQGAGIGQPDQRARRAAPGLGGELSWEAG